MALAASTLVFTATPLILRPLSVEYGITIGAVGLISTAQLAGFVLASWFAGRFLHPGRSLFVTLCIGGTAANLVSAFSPNLAVLCGARMVCGLTLGLAAWFGWHAAFCDEKRIGDLSVVGPIVGALGSPLIAVVVAQTNVRGVYLLLAGLTAFPLLLSHQVASSGSVSQRSTVRHRPTRAAVAILIALGMITLSGSAVFVFAAAIGS